MGKIATKKMNLNKSNNRAQPQVIDGIKFPSKLEAGVYLYYKKLQTFGAAKIVKLQPKLSLSKAKIPFRPDFEIIDPKYGGNCYAEAKGVETDSYKLKLKLYRAYGDRPLLIYKGTMNSPTLVEVVYPEGVNNG